MDDQDDRYWGVEHKITYTMEEMHHDQEELPSDDRFLTAMVAILMCVMTIVASIILAVLIWWSP